MANVVGERTIKANIIGDGNPISANLVQNANVIKSNVSNSSSASTEQKGIIRIATLEEAQEGIDNSTAITPYTLKNVEISSETFTHEQGVSSDIWVIEHNLNKYPSVTLVDSAGLQFQGSVKYINENSCIVYMNGATKGKAYLN